MENPEASIEELEAAADEAALKFMPMRAELDKLNQREEEAQRALDEIVMQIAQFEKTPEFCRAESVFYSAKKALENARVAADVAAITASGRCFVHRDFWSDQGTRYKAGSTFTEVSGVPAQMLKTLVERGAVSPV